MEIIFLVCTGWMRKLVRATIITINMVWQYLSLLSVQPSIFNPQNSNMKASFYQSAFIRKCNPVSGSSTIPLAYSTTCSLSPGVRWAGSHRSEQALLGQDTLTCDFHLIDNGKAQNPPLTKGEWPAGIGHSPSWKLTGRSTWTTNIRLSKITFKETLGFWRRCLSFCLHKDAPNFLLWLWIPLPNSWARNWRESWCRVTTLGL